MASAALAAERMLVVRHKILVLSGKGGVGKSTVAAQLALSLRAAGKKVGILDVDICGPSIPHIMGVAGEQVFGGDDGWLPVYVDNEKNLGVMSIAFLLGGKDDAVIWRGPRKNSMVVQFIEQVNWGPLDYLIVDTPPGTSDEHISIVESLRAHEPDGAIIVTTPQGLSISDVRKEVNFCRKLELPIIGVVENMSGFVCPGCKDIHNIFAKGGGEEMAKDMELKFLGSVPIDPTLSLAEDHGENFQERFKQSPAADSLLHIAKGVVEQCDEIALSRAKAFTEQLKLGSGPPPDDDA